MFFRAGFATIAPAALGPEGQDITVCHQLALDGAMLVLSSMLLAASRPCLARARSWLKRLRTYALADRSSAADAG